MSVSEQKQLEQFLEEKRKRMKSMGGDLDIVDKVRLQRLQKREEDRQRQIRKRNR